ncbi:MAG: glycosyltransferase N-terminal domain-containing protein [Bacteroidota bacterium]|nr:glycosyltransferase N-terminal domain-containing protein [Bacteroidota bacterium]
MTPLYNNLIRLYNIAIRVAALTGNIKARQWVDGRKDIFRNLENKLQSGERRIWVHAASLGEFEQGRPLIEKIKEQHPEYKIFLTFFSPSGYEVRKNYAGADYIFYLPADTPGNARRFIDLVNPEKVFFIKYEFWYNYLSLLKKRDIPAYLCSSIFRSNQLFFKPYGGWYRKILSFFSHLFVQTEASALLLKNIGFTNVTVTGDTRFDRVYAIASQAREIDEVKTFVGDKQCLIAGSTWEPDEDLLSQYINETPSPLKYIIAPHEIQVSHIDRLEKSIQKKVVRFSSWKLNPSGDFDVLIIDNIGMLSSLYRYGQVAYIGGGFGKGIHNILEAATFGLPVLFGPNHKKFQEALDLIDAKGAFPIQCFTGLKNQLDRLFNDPQYLQTSGNTAGNFVKQNIGATNKILSSIL